MNSKTFSTKAYKKEKELFIKQGGFFSKGFLKENKLECEYVINLIHGRDGEDGKLRLYLSFILLNL